MADHAPFPEAECAALTDYYTVRFDENVRLRDRSAQGVLEFVRTQELIAERIPQRCAILDVGGGTGVHAEALVRAGHDVEMIDPVPHHVVQARASGLHAAVGDARALQFEDGRFDVVLLLGPLYHLRRRDNRLLALREARRVLRPGGLLFAGAISRFAALGSTILGRPTPHPLPDTWVALFEHGDISPELATFPGGHAHTAESLQHEIAVAGFLNVEVHAVEGAAGLSLESLSEPPPGAMDVALALVRALGTRPGDRDISNHLIGIATTS